MEIFLTKTVPEKSKETKREKLNNFSCVIVCTFVSMLPVLHSIVPGAENEKSRSELIKVSRL